MKITGYYGCNCHPFESLDELKKFQNQKIEVGAKYRIRHSGIECVAKGFDKEFPEFVKVFVQPYDCPRCNQIEHKSNLIKL